MPPVKKPEVPPVEAPVEAPPAPNGNGDSNGAPDSNDRLAAAIEAQTAMLAQMAQAPAPAHGGTFAPGESAEAVERSLRGTVSEGPPPEHPLRTPVEFRSRGKVFSVVRKHRQRYTSSTGDIVVTDGVTYDFAPNGSYETVDPDVVEFLRGAGSFNREFFEVGNEPHAEPSAEGVLKEIIVAGFELDDARLEEIEKRETSSLKRPQVIVAVKETRKQIQGLRAEAAAREGAPA